MRFFFLLSAICLFGFFSLAAQIPHRFYLVGEGGQDRPLPLLVFLHGAGERGEDNERQLIHLRSWQDKLPEACYVFAPQCPLGHRWVEVDWGAAAHAQPLEASEPMKAVLAQLEVLRQDQRIDSQRVYLLGLSMGGYGVWDLALRRPTWFAALVPICGGADPHLACRLTQSPVWLFHGAEDKVVKVKRSREMFEALQNCGNQQVCYTEWAKIGHNAWKPAFELAALWQWLFEQRQPIK